MGIQDMAFELLGPNLENLFNQYRWKFSLKMVLLLVDQFIPRFQYIHFKGSSTETSSRTIY